jgi:uncharacterized protein YjiK
LCVSSCNGKESGGESSHLINSSIEEASGITYSKRSDSLFVVDDEGWLIEISTKGKVLRKKYFGDHDFEGVTIQPGSNDLYLLVEGEEKIMIVDSDSLDLKATHKIHRSFQGVEVLKKHKKHGVEGIHFFGNSLYIVKQSDHTNPKKHPTDSSALMMLEQSKDGKDFEIVSVTYLPFTDLAGISSKKGHIIMISDDDDLMLEYAVGENDVISTFQFANHDDQEGIAFDSEGNMYLALDGTGILKISK